MLWAIHCIDVAHSAALRDKSLALHRAHLMASKPMLVLACAIQSDDGAMATGSLFIVKAGKREEAQAFIDSDPFMKHGVFQSITLSSLRKGLWNLEALQGL